MPTPILMPALSPTMEAGTLAKWLVKEGDQVNSGDVIAEIETDKATMEVEAVDEGTVGKIVVAEGTADVPVNDTIAILLMEGEDAGAVDAAPAAAAPAPAASNGAEPAAAAPAESAAPAPSAAPAASMNGGGRVAASPLARRLAEQAGLDLSAITGSGPNGRIVKRDVEAAKAAPKPAAAAPAADKPAAPKAAAPAPAAMAQGMTDEQIRASFPDGTFEEIPHDGMRKTIARRLTESKQTVPHFYLTREVSLDALLALRGELNASAPEVDGKPAYKISVNDFVIKAMALSLAAVPKANAVYTPTARLVFKSVDVGVAVAIPDGLITPVIRSADTKSLSAISNEMKDLAKRARDKKLRPDEYSGGATAVSNLGMFGIKEFAAVINPPHGSILAVGAGEKRPVVKGGELAVSTMMTVTLSVDHRVVDGALGAEVLQAFSGFVENPMRLLV
ncbi:MAG: pyruvate dehydrogenase complex dihydrolipoamide acetyltransferase [Pseudomonadota bacterium]